MMKNRGVKFFGMGLTLLCLIATTVQAGPLQIQFESGHLNGVDRYGCLKPCYGADTCFVSLVNTNTGWVIGTGSACVINCSNRPQVYVNGCFGYICGVNVCSSLYLVSQQGAASLFYQGYLSFNGPV